MKKIILLNLTFLLSLSLFAQFSTSNGNTTTLDDVGIGSTNTNGYKLHVDGNGRINSGTETADLLNLNAWISNSTKYKGTMLNFTSGTDGNYGHFKFIKATDATGLKFSLNSQGNIYTAGTVGIGGINTNGYKLHVDGNGRINSGTETANLLNLNAWISNSTKYKGTMLNFTTGTDGNYGHFKFIQATDATGLKFSLNSQGNIYTAGNVGIGTTSPDSKLTVAGNIHSREVKVTINAGADFVFDNSYELRSLEETESFIIENKHLPEIAPENEMIENGLQVGMMNIKLLQKIEELTLYLIEQNKEIKELKEKVQSLENK